MPRLGEDANVATAYRGRGQSNLRGGWLRQMLVTGLGTLALLYIMHNVLRKDYKDESIKTMRSKGYSEERIDKLVQKTSKEKQRDQALANQSTEDQLKHLKEEIANLTRTVQELQGVLVNQTGASLQHPLWVNLVDQKKENSGGDGGGRR